MPVLANQQNRETGEYVTSEVATPARGQNKATKFIVRFTMPAEEVADPTLFLEYRVQLSIDGSAWLEFGGDWTGGQINRDGSPKYPSAGWASFDNRVLTRAKVRWTQNKAARLGVSLDFEEVTVAAGALAHGNR